MSEHHAERRQHPRPPIVLRIRVAARNVEELATRYVLDLTPGGIFVRTRQPRPVGTRVRLEILLADGTPAIRAEGEVRSAFHEDPTADPPVVPGMGIRFVEMDAASRALIERICAARGSARTGSRPAASQPRQASRPAGAAPGRDPSVVVATPGLSQGPPPGAGPGGATHAGVAARSAPGPAARSAPQPPSVALATGSTGSAPAVPQIARAGKLELRFDRSDLRLPGLVDPQEPPATGPVIGIDLGTSNSCAAWVRDGRPSVLPSREGYPTIPSLVALRAPAARAQIEGADFIRGTLVVGHPAAGQRQLDPRNTVYGSKRLVGRPFDSPVVQQSRERFLYEIVEGADGQAAVRLGGATLSLEEISALILAEVREQAQNAIGEPIRRAVVTVPAYYNEHQREAVRRAGRLAGLRIERIVSEPTAAALAYGYGKSLERRLLVYDLGGGTFDASVLELHGNVFEVVSTGGDTFLGGVDFDTAIADHLLACFEQAHGRPFDGDPVALQRVFDAAERAKRVLSEQESWRVHLPFVTIVDGRPLDLDVTLDRATVERLCRPLVERTLGVCADVLAQRNLQASEIDDILLVGGMSRMPLVRRMIRERFGLEPNKGVHPDEAVAIGAALLARSLETVEGVILIDVLPMSIQVGNPGGLCTRVIERNAPLPVTRTFRVTTARDNQASFEIHVFQGESEQAAMNEFLGTLRIDGIPPGPKGSVQAAVTFHLNAECLLEVSARDPASGKEIRTVFNTRAPKRAAMPEGKLAPQAAATAPSEPVPVAGMLASDGTATLPSAESPIVRLLRRWFRARAG